MLTLTYAIAALGITMLLFLCVAISVSRDQEHTDQANDANGHRLDRMAGRVPEEQGA